MHAGWPAFPAAFQSILSRNVGATPHPAIALGPRIANKHWAVDCEQRFSLREGLVMHVRLRKLRACTSSASRWARRLAPTLLLGLAAAATAPRAAVAAEGDLDLANALAADPPQWQWGDLEFQLGGEAGGALFAAHQDGGPGRPQGYADTGVSGLASANLRVQRIFDDGMVVGARGEVLLYRDALSGDIYGNDTIEKLYGFVQTGFGRLEVGEQDGAGYQLALTGPQVEQLVSLEGAGISLFRDPLSGDQVGPAFTQVTAVQSSSNYAKINYVSPRLFGVQIGASFTPHIVREPLPFAGNPANVADGQNSIWEIAAGYSDYIGQVAVGLSAAYAHGGLRNRTFGFADLSDWSLGSQFAYMLGAVKLSLGADYRQTNAYLLDPTQALKGGGTHATHLSATGEWGSWVFGAEYVFADVTGPTHFNLAGYEAAAGYKLNDNLQISAGWQWQNRRRDAGAFYQGARGIDMNAGFLSLSYSL
jgi:predicted porin